MKKILMLTILLTSVFLANYSAAVEKSVLSKADMEKLSGQWGGRLKSPHGDFLKVFRFEIKKDGEFKVFFNAPAQGPIWRPVSDIELVDGNLTLQLAYAGEEYKGKIIGDEILGEWVQGEVHVPLNLKKGEYIHVAAMNLSRKAMERLAGQWHGLLKMPGNEPIIQVFRFKLTENGEFNTSYDMPDDGIIDITVSDMDLVDSTNALKFSYDLGEFKGKIIGDEIAGEVMDSGKLTLKKGEYKPDRNLNLSKEIRDKLSGEWHGQVKTPDGSSSDVAFFFSTTAKGDFAGYYEEFGYPYRPSIKEADYTNNKLTLNIGSLYNVKFNGTLAGDVLTGELMHPGLGNIHLSMKKAEDDKTLIDIVEEKPPYPGYLYRPNDNASHPGILFLHGSEGGNGNFNPAAPGDTGENAGTPSLAREYARRGYVTYALCWFDCKHHEDYDDYPPDELKEIDIYKTTYEAFLWLKKSDYVQDKKVAIWGVSMGAEQALLLASLVGKHKESMNLIEPDAILADSPSDIVSSAFTNEGVDSILRGEKYVGNSDDSSWMLNNKKIKPGTPIDIQYYNGPVLITYFTNDPKWGVTVNPENLVKKYLKNNIPHTYIQFCDENDVSKAWKTARDNMDKNIVINFTKEKGHVNPGEPKSFSLKYEVTKEFLKTHLDN